MTRCGMGRKGALVTDTAVVSVLHLAVDMTTAGFVFSSAAAFGTQGFLIAIVLYNLFAFGLQPLFGLICDHKKAVRPMLFLSLALIGIFGLAPFWVWANLVVLGVANAAFHVSAASVVLANQPHKASGLGVYVSTGAIGLAIGVSFLAVPVLVGGAICLFSVLLYPYFKQNTAIEVFCTIQAKQKPIKDAKWVLPLMLVLFAVLIRGFLGGALKPQWQILPWHAVAVALCIAAGKAVGGVLADALGAPLTAMLTLIPAAILLAFLKDTVAGAVIGLVLFNTAMPVTLLLATELLPKNRAFGFGLTACILMMGSLVAAMLKPAVFSAATVFTVIIGGAACIVAGSFLSKRCDVKIKTNFGILSYQNPKAARRR